ncbi:MAP3K7 C-terminal-like protein isoform B [Alligator mississippiensis]|uniref:MAP3K7 C-terminal-like protein isoform B n=1 Tax=Alligator mississippiensis TaxID=8496 RepID=A0A151MDZ5_ALLMI|nr:MAP3K7 C-terminal-like protein isoform B [Alligator mississippiensis]
MGSAGNDKPRQWLALDYTSADTPLSEGSTSLKPPFGVGSLRRKAKDRVKPRSCNQTHVGRLFHSHGVPLTNHLQAGTHSLNDSPDDAPPESTFPLAFPELDQQLQPLPPCHDSKESMQVYKQHCKIAEEYHEVKKEIALLEERKKELIARLEQTEKESMDAAQLAEEYAALTEENRTLKLAQTQCVEQLEKLRIQYQKRQGSS